MTKWLTVSLVLLLLPAPAFAGNSATSVDRNRGETGAPEGAISIAASADTQSPYQNQSVLYTIRVVARVGMANAFLSDIQVANAIVERQGEPEVHRSVDNGAPANIIAYHFIITPLQPGSVIVPPVELKGDIEPADSGAASDPFMARISRAMNTISLFAGSQPFSVASNKTVLNVKPAVVATGPWLPLTSLKISEDMSVPQSVRVGNPLIRKITLLANGAVGSQLLSVEDQQNHADFKVYAEKTVTGRDIDKKTGSILGWRTESFRLVPQKPGTVILPAVRISWWNIVTNRASTAELPERIVNVIEGSTARTPPAGMVTHNAAKTSSGTPRGLEGPGSGLLRTLGAVLVIGLLSVILCWLGWRYTTNALRNISSSVVPRTKSRPRKPRFGSGAAMELKYVREPGELKTFLQDYAHERWGTTRNASLERMFATRKTSGTEKQREDIDAFVRDISAALYAGRMFEIEDLKKRCLRIIGASNRKRVGGRKGHQKLVCLNPD